MKFHPLLEALDFSFSMNFMNSHNFMISLKLYFYGIFRKIVNSLEIIFFRLNLKIALFPMYSHRFWQGIRLHAKNNDVTIFRNLKNPDAAASGFFQLRKILTPRRQDF